MDSVAPGADSVLPPYDSSVITDTPACDVIALLLTTRYESQIYTLTQKYENHMLELKQQLNDARKVHNSTESVSKPGEFNPMYLYA